MKLRLDGIQDSDCVRSIIDALLQVDLGARINIDQQAQLVRIEGRLTLDDATSAITHCGFQVASIVDSTTVDTVGRPLREVHAF